MASTNGVSVTTNVQSQQRTRGRATSVGDLYLTFDLDIELDIDRLLHNHLSSLEEFEKSYKHILEIIKSNNDEQVAAKEVNEKLKDYIKSVRDKMQNTIINSAKKRKYIADYEHATPLRETEELISVKSSKYAGYKPNLEFHEPDPGQANIIHNPQEQL